MVGVPKEIVTAEQIKDFSTVAFDGFSHIRTGTVVAFILFADGTRWALSALADETNWKGERDVMSQISISGRQNISNSNETAEWCLFAVAFL